MKTGTLRFDADMLREQAGKQVFERGKDYWRDGRVSILALEPQRVLAEVAGTETYRTTLRGGGKQIHGDCSCPAFGNWGLCKHLVATALAVNAAGDGAQEDTFSRIRTHLRSKGVEALVEMIVELAERDSALFRSLQLKAIAVGADDKTIENQLRKAITAATRTGGYVEYSRVKGWSAGVETALRAVSDLIEGGRADIALRLAEYAMDRIEAALESLDDSDGHGGGLLLQALDIHHAAAVAARPEPVTLARFLYKHEMEEDYDTFAGAAAQYAEVLGEAGLAEYRRLAEEAWAALPSRTAVRGGAELSYDHARLAEIIDFFAERDGDTAARIALRAKDLSSPWRYKQLAEFCLSQGRGDEALRFAEEGLWVFEDKVDERLVFFAVDLLKKRNRTGEAEAVLQKAFEQAPSFKLYQQLRGLAGDSACGRATTLLEARLAREKRTQWHYPADLLIRILVLEKMFDDAWAAVAKHGASMGVREALAKAGEATHPREALTVYAERIDQLVEAGGNPAYEEAACLIERISRLQGAAEQAKFMDGIKARFGRKRNLMKLLV